MDPKNEEGNITVTETFSSESIQAELEPSSPKQSHEAVFQEDFSTKTPTINLNKPSTTSTPSLSIPGEMQVDVVIGTGDS